MQSQKIIITTKSKSRKAKIIVLKRMCNLNTPNEATTKIGTVVSKINALLKRIVKVKVVLKTNKRTDVKDLTLLKRAGGGREVILVAEEDVKAIAGGSAPVATLVEAEEATQLGGGAIAIRPGNKDIAEVILPLEEGGTAKARATAEEVTLAPESLQFPTTIESDSKNFLQNFLSEILAQRTRIQKTSVHLKSLENAMLLSKVNLPLLSIE